jgi:hypothetical protein
MTAATLFSGIGAPEMAMPEWRWLWHAEIEKFPAAVMRERHPASVNLGDVTAEDFVERAIAIGRPDVLVFGSPCQSYSVAGKRLGLDDPRGNLALVALGIAARLEPTLFPVFCPPATDETSGFSCEQWMNSGITSAGRTWTRSMPVWRSGASVCSLSATLETGAVPPPYYLSPKACAGILRRAKKRGKVLPRPLEQALQAVAARMAPAPTPF